MSKEEKKVGTKQQNKDVGLTDIEKYYPEEESRNKIIM